MNTARRLTAEALGSVLLAAAVVGSGVMAERLSGGNAAIALLANTGATVAVLATLIALMGPSAARTSIRPCRLFRRCAMNSRGETPGPMR